MATTQVSLPNYREPIQDAQGNISRAWWLFFQGIAKTLGGGQVPDLSTIIQAISDLTDVVEDQAIQLPDTALHDLSVAISEVASRLETTQNVTKLQSKIDELEALIGDYQRPAQNTPFVEAFIAPTLLNSWVNFGGTVPAPAGYYKDPLGVVRLRGLLASGTMGNAIFQLPVGYRPPFRSFFPTLSNGLFGSGYVDQDGTVIPLSGSNVYFALDGITFRAA